MYFSFFFMFPVLLYASPFHCVYVSYVYSVVVLSRVAIVVWYLSVSFLMLLCPFITSVPFCLFFLCFLCVFLFCLFLVFFLCLFSSSSFILCALDYSVYVLSISFCVFLCFPFACFLFLSSRIRLLVFLLFVSCFLFMFPFLLLLPSSTHKQSWLFICTRCLPFMCCSFWLSIVCFHICL